MFRREGTKLLPVIDQQKRSIRILHVFSVLALGGAETWLLSLLRYFHQQKGELPFTVTFDILLTGGKRAVFDDEAEALGACLFYVPFTRRSIRSFIHEFRKILKEGNYDAIHDHQDYVAGLHFAMGRSLLPPVRIAHVHNPLYHRTNQKTRFSSRSLNQLGKYFAGRYATHVMGTSRQIVTEYGFDDYSGALTLGAAHCGFDVSRYRGDHAAVHADLCREFGWDESARILLFVGRLEGAEFLYEGRVMTHKNPAFALEVARQCVAKDRRVKLLMVGAGEGKRQEFEAQVRAWKLDGVIRFPGVRSDVPRLMIGSDLFLFPSVAEGLGMVVVEAQAAGLPVLASDTTPRECVVVPELTEFVPIGVAPELWATRALRSLDTRRDSNLMSNQAVEKSGFSIKNSAQHLLRLYGAALQFDEPTQGGLESSMLSNGRRC
ncbi:MAG: glycosyltransferase [Pyrinomonadaceae bacterium]